jgi:flagellin
VGVTVGSATDSTLMAAINANYAKTGVTASMDSTGVLTLNAQDGRNITLTLTANGAARSGLKAGAGTTTDAGKLTLRSTDAYSIGGNGNLTARTQLGSGAVAQSSTENVNAIDLSSKSGAQLAIKIVDTALGQLNSRRAQIGALTNRLNTTINNLNSASENASASQSRILDADFAEETAKMQRGQILQQAGIAILAQANQGPQQALSLLR